MTITIDPRCNKWVSVQATNGVPRWAVTKIGYRCSQPGDPPPNDLNDMSANIYVTVLNENGVPIVGIVVHQNTPDDENHARKYTHDWDKLHGSIDFFQSENSGFDPNSTVVSHRTGPYRIWCQGNSDTVHGLGLPLKRHVSYDITFQRVVNDSPPPDEPPDEPPAGNGVTEERVKQLINEALERAKF